MTIGSEGIMPGFVRGENHHYPILFSGNIAGGQELSKYYSWNRSHNKNQICFCEQESNMFIYNAFFILPRQVHEIPCYSLIYAKHHMHQKMSDITIIDEHSQTRRYIKNFFSSKVWPDIQQLPISMILLPEI